MECQSCALGRFGKEGLRTAVREDNESPRNRASARGSLLARPAMWGELEELAVGAMLGYEDARQRNAT